MAVDKDLFLYDLAIVAIMKNEAPYVKEWLDYHILAGVDHFYIYDNDSPDNLKEILKPYIDEGIVTYKFYPGVQKQIEAYTEAFKMYRFFCRYMAFIDADEFIFPQNNKSIVEVVDEFLEDNPTAGGLSINWMMYGSNNLEKADYNKGVLERFTRRASNFEAKVKSISNPRKINYLTTPHFVEYFLGFITIDFRDFENTNPLNEKILINHYKLKSREEFLRKYNLGSEDASYGGKEYYNEKNFTHEKNNDVFDDSILAYRDALSLQRGGRNVILTMKKYLML
ncbi:MAG: glycosyltransferase family 92 protein [Selenomonadaceae bacterium]|nr:glycosyltransferase family 92 protein [Selenomonadaceae bacterium]